MYLHEMFLHPAHGMRYYHTSCHRASHRLQHPGSGNHIGNWYPPPPIYISFICGVLLLFCLSLCPIKDDASTVNPHTVQLTLVHFLFLNVTPSPVSLSLCAASLHFPQMYPGVHTKAFVFSRFLSCPTRQKISTDTVRVSCTQIWSLTHILPSSA